MSVYLHSSVDYLLLFLAVKDFYSFALKPVGVLAVHVLLFSFFYLADTNKLSPYMLMSRMLYEPSSAADFAFSWLCAALVECVCGGD